MSKVTGLACFILAATCVVVASFYGFPRNPSFNIWIPEQYSMVNVALDDASHYGVVEKASLSGTAVYLPLDQFRKVFGSVSIEMIVDKRAQVWYLAKRDGHLYVAKTRSVRAWYVTTATSFGLGSDSLTLTKNSEVFLVVPSLAVAVVLALAGLDAWAKK